MLRPARSSRSAAHRVARGALFLLSLVLIPGRGIGAEEVPDAAFARLAVRDARLDVAPVLEPVDADDPQAHGRPGLDAFYARYTTDWEIQWDLRSDRPHLVQGVGIPLLPGAGNQLTAEELGLERNEVVDLRTVELRIRDLMASMSDFLGIAPSQLQLDPRRTTTVGDTLWLLAFEQNHDGVPVEGAQVFWRINHGNIVQFGTYRVAPVTLSTTPGLSREQAFDQAMTTLGILCQNCELLEPGRLVILPVAADDGGLPSLPGEGYAHLLAWHIVYRPPGGPGYRLRVDAHTGEVLEHHALVRFGAVQGVVHVAADELELVPFPHTAVENEGLKVTDAAGSYLYEGGLAQTQLAGALIQIQDDCGPVSSTSVTGDGLLDLGAGGTDCTTSGTGGAGNTQAARDAFFHLSGAYDRMLALHPQLGPALGWPLIARTNRTAAPCSAFWNSAEGSLNFSQSGDGCTNTGEVPSVLYHEWGHAVDEALGGVAVDGASGEAAADIFALLEARHACIGRGLRPGETCYNCTADCTGVRDLQAFALGGNSTLAHPTTIEDDAGIDCDRFPCPYQGNATYQGPMGYQAHCESYIASTAVYDLAMSMQGSWGDEGAWKTTQSLWFRSLPALGSAYRPARPGMSCDPQMPVNGCAADNWYTVFLAVNDDDGNLWNGTPHACQIYDAFATHGIACGARPACACSTESPIADAGPDATICAGDAVTIGTPALPDHTYLWAPGGETTAQLTVSPNVDTAYTLVASTACGFASDQVIVRVVNCGDLDGDFEEGAVGWSTSGLWHLAGDSACATPGYASPSKAMYYGQDESCDYATGSRTRGDLISPVMTGITANSLLRFDYFRDVEDEVKTRDRAEVAIAIADSPHWQPRWAKTAADPGTGSWKPAPAISLAPYAGQEIRLRFRFESWDGKQNEGTGWFVDSVYLLEGGEPAPNQPPVVMAQQAPAEVSECECLTCLFAAQDPEDGDLGPILSWHSSHDGYLGSGARLSTVLSPGTHILTATVTDYGGLSASQAITVNVIADLDHCAHIPGWPPVEPLLHCSADEDP